MLNGWAYAAIYRSSADRAAALDGWLWHYNHRRKHAALGHRPGQQNQRAWVLHLAGAERPCGLECGEL